MARCFGLNLQKGLDLNVIYWFGNMMVENAVTICLVLLHYGLHIIGETCKLGQDPKEGHQRYFQFENERGSYIIII